MFVQRHKTAGYKRASHEAILLSGGDRLYMSPQRYLCSYVGHRFFSSMGDEDQLEAGVYGNSFRIGLIEAAFYIRLR